MEDRAEKEDRRKIELRWEIEGSQKEDKAGLRRLRKYEGNIEEKRKEKRNEEKEQRKAIGGKYAGGTSKGRRNNRHLLRDKFEIDRSQL